MLEKSIRAAASWTLLHGLMTEIKWSLTGLALPMRIQPRRKPAAGQGVCQDHAHIFSGAVRHLGIPSRYVTGYLALEGGESATASHAWAEACCRIWAGLGLTGQRQVPTDHYVRVAAALMPRHYPIGAAARAAAEEMRVKSM
jgi:hypothetical protein